MYKDAQKKFEKVENLADTFFGSSPNSFFN